MMAPIFWGYFYENSTLDVARIQGDVIEFPLVQDVAGQAGGNLSFRYEIQDIVQSDVNEDDNVYFQQYPDDQLVLHFTATYQNGPELLSEEGTCVYEKQLPPHYDRNYLTQSQFGNSSKLLGTCPQAFWLTHVFHKAPNLNLPIPSLWNRCFC